MAANVSEPLELREFAGTGDPGRLLPLVTRENAPFFDGLRARTLTLQVCAACVRARFPVGPVCPNCGSRSFEWRALSGRGTIHSWLRYRRSYLAEFEPLMPYVVACVQLEEGARIFGRLAGGHPEPEIGHPVRAIVERWAGGQLTHAFAVVATGTDRSGGGSRRPG